jgi:hypothetical protein
MFMLRSKAPHLLSGLLMGHVNHVVVDHTRGLKKMGTYSCRSNKSQKKFKRIAVLHLRPFPFHSFFLCRLVS